MKNRILIILLMFIILIGLSGCSFKKTSSSTPKNKKEIKDVKKENKKKKKKEEKTVTLNKDIVVGHYELVGMTDGKITYTKEELEELKETGYIVTVVFEKETGVLKLGEEQTKFKYDDKFVYINDEKIAYEYSDNKLILKQEDQELTFEKIK